MTALTPSQLFVHVAVRSRSLEIAAFLLITLGASWSVVLLLAAPAVIVPAIGWRPN